MNVFADKVALVTGGGTGIGRSTALDFARKGASVMIADINPEEARMTLAMVAELGGKSQFVNTDVSHPQECERMVKQTVEAFGRLDYAFNNAGIAGVAASTADFEPGDWQHVIDVNLSGIFYSMKYEIPQMLKQSSGVIVNMASVLGKIGFAGAGAYTAAKHGVLGLTKVAALEYAERGIRINAVCPGFVITPMLEKQGLLSNKEMRRAIENLHPIGRLGHPEEIAKAVTFLCSPDASFMVGEAMTIDGGYAAGSLPRFESGPEKDAEEFLAEVDQIYR